MQSSSRDEMDEFCKIHISPKVSAHFSPSYNNKYTAECQAVYITFPLFAPARAKPLEISPSCQDPVKDINLTSTADMAVYPDISPQYITGTRTLAVPD